MKLKTKSKNDAEKNWKKKMSQDHDKDWDQNKLEHHLLGKECYAGEMFESFMHFRQSFAEIYMYIYQEIWEK